MRQVFVVRRSDLSLGNAARRVYEMVVAERPGTERGRRSRISAKSCRSRTPTFGLSTASLRRAGWQLRTFARETLRRRDRSVFTRNKWFAMAIDFRTCARVLFIGRGSAGVPRREFWTSPYKKLNERCMRWRRVQSSRYELLWGTLYW